MKTIFLLVVLAVMVSACAGNNTLHKSGISARSDVFRELTDGGVAPQGYVDLRISFSMKTHSPGFHAANDPHGTPDYGLVVNIDGQSLKLKGALLEEKVEPRGLRDPEGGEGIRYWFDKRLRLKAGPHNVVVAIPADSLAIERKITLAEGENNDLVLEPIYSGIPIKGHPTSYSKTSFKEGIRGVRFLLNGNEI